MGAVTAIQLHRTQLEISIVWGLSARLLLAAVLTDTGLSSTVLASFTALVLLAGCLESWPPSSRWRTRAAESQGICVGTSAVPAVLLALHIVVPNGVIKALMVASMAASYAMLLLHLWHTVAAPAAPLQQPGQSESDAPRPDSTAAAATAPGPAAVRRSAVHYFGLCLALLSILMLSTLPRHLQQQHQWLPHQQHRDSHSCNWTSILASTAASIGPLTAAAALAALVGPLLLHIQLELMPGCFTLGEAFTLAQGNTCLAIAAVHQLLLQGTAPDSPWTFSIPTALTNHLGVDHWAVPAVQQRPLVLALQQHAAAAASSLDHLMHDIKLLLRTWTRLQPSPLPPRPVRSFIVVLLSVVLLGAGCTAVAVQGWLRLRLALRSRPHATGTHNQQQASAAASSPTTTTTRRAHQGSRPTAGGGNVPRPSIAAALGWLLLVPLALLALLPILLVIVNMAGWTLLVFLPAQPLRWQLLLYWLGTLMLGLPIMRSSAARAGLPQIVLRKGYHLLAAALFVPVFFWDRELLCVSLAIAFAVLVVVEGVRCCRVPVVGRWVHMFMVDFVDERDSGVVFVTHFTLLVGLALPMWLTLWLDAESAAAAAVAGGSRPPAGAASSDACALAATATAAGVGVGEGGQALSGTANAPLPVGCQAAAGAAAAAAGAQQQVLTVLAGLSGMVIIGVGDTMAAYVGKLYGTHAIHHGSRKTLQGTLAGAVSSMLAWALLLWCVGLSGALYGGSCSRWLQLGVVTTAASLLEACTTQLDNLMIPLVYLPQVLLIAAGNMPS